MTNYAFIRRSASKTTVFKFDDSFKLLATHAIIIQENGTAFCTCKGAYNRIPCKHKQMWWRWKELKEPKWFFAQEQGVWDIEPSWLACVFDSVLNGDIKYAS